MFLSHSFINYYINLIYRKKYPPKFILELLNSWLGESEGQEVNHDSSSNSEDNQLGRLLPSLSAALNSANVLFTSPHQYSAQQTLIPLVTLAKWSILSPILSNEQETLNQYLEDYSRLHSAILECLNDISERRYEK